MDFSRLPVQRLERMARAADEIVAVVEEYGARNTHLVGDLLDQSVFTVGAHYPPDDVYDFATGAGYYYHAHPPGARVTPAGLHEFSEHGHFHLFVNRRAVPKGVKPLRRPGRPVEGWGVCHLGAIVLDMNGVPSRLFTIHQWLSKEWMYPAPVVAELIDRFAIADAGRSARVTRWVVAMTVLFRPQLEHLLHARDRVLAAQPPLVRPRHGKSLDITSVIDIDLDRQIAAVERARRRGPRSRASHGGR